MAVPTKIGESGVGGPPSADGCHLPAAEPASGGAQAQARAADSALTSDECTRLAELESVVERGIAGFIDVGNALMEIRDSCLYRGTHSTFEAYCRRRWDISRSRGYQMIDAAAVSTIVDIPNEAQARELVPLLPDESALVETWREAKDEYGEDKVTAVNLKALVRNRLERIQREEEAELRESQEPIPQLPSTSDVRHCGVADLEVKPGSVSLIFTDPPYPGEFLPCWEQLAGFASRALAPGRLLVSYSGQYHLPEVMYALGCELQYVWMGALVTPGAHNQVQRRHIRSNAKPLLFYSRDEYELGPWFEDAYVSERRDKDSHDWQQSVGAARYFIETLTKPGDLVVDPFLGSGTTAVAAQELGRRFIGCDVDESAVQTAKRRLAA